MAKINWKDKNDSPELLAFLAQHGDEFYLSAQEINEIKNAINEQDTVATELAFPNEVIFRGPVLLENGIVSISANDFTARINQNIVSNADDYNVVINPATHGFNRTDIIVINQNGEFTKIQGQESIDVAVKPVPSADTLEITSINILGSTILSPIPSDKAKLDRAGYNGTAATLDQKIDGVREDAMSRFDDFEYEMEEIKLPLKADKSNTYSKEEVDLKVVGIYKFKGNKTDYADLLATTGMAIGDVYNLLINEKNYGWTGTSWDDLGGVFDISGKEDVINKSQDIEADKNSSSKYTSVKAIYNWCNSLFQFKLISGTNIKSINGNSILDAGNLTVGDMTTNTPQSVTSLKTFLHGMLGLRNVANTFTSFFSNSNTASRTYTLQNRDGTLADLTDIASVNTNKMNVPTGGIANFLPRFLTATTIGLSRLWDTGSKLGIGVTKTPTEDITFGNQTLRTIGIEASSNTNHGRDLIVSAGRTVNFTEGTGFQALLTGLSGAFNGVAIDPISKDIFVTINGWIYVRYGGSGTFMYLNNSGPNRGLVSDSAGNIYGGVSGGAMRRKATGSSTWVNYPTTGATGSISNCAVSNSGDVYIGTTDGLWKQTSGTGSFVKIFSAVGGIENIAISHTDGSIYAFEYNPNNLWKQTGGTGPFFNVWAGPLCRGLVCALDGNVYAVNDRTLFKQEAGAGPFINMNTSIPSGQWITGLAADHNSSVYAVNASGNDVYFLDNNAVGSANLNGGTKSERAGTGKGAGQSRWDVWTGQKTASGTNMQALVKRIEVDEIGAFLLLTDHIYDNNAAAVAAGLRKGSLYWNSAGDLKIVI